MIIILALIAVFFVVFVAMGLKIVRQSEIIIIERLGKYNRTLSSGINVIIPLFDQARELAWRFTLESPDGRRVTRFVNKTRVDLRETVFDFPRQNVITKDNVGVEINAMLYFQILDPIKAVYEIQNLPDAIEKLTQTTLRNIIGELELDETLTSRDTINTKLRIILDDATNKWGVKVNRVELQDINPPHDIKQAMEKQMRAERDRRAAILEAEGEKRAAILKSEGAKESAINRAEGEKRSAILYAEGDAEARITVAKAEADALKTITDAITSEGGDPVNYMVALKYIEAFEKMVSGKDNKVVYLPYEASNLLGSIGGIKDLFKTAP